MASSESVPITRVPVVSGTHIADFSPRERICASWAQSPRAAANSASSVTSRTSSGSPVRITIAGPRGASGGSGGNAFGKRHPPLELAVLGLEVDRAPAREARHQQPRDAFERLLARETRAEDRSYAREQRELRGGLLLSD